jgi:RNA polymerase sigma-70 factor (ECF subfamily)
MDFDNSLAAAQSGDEDGFAMLWRELHPPLIRYLRVLAPNSADDIASECWLQVIRSLGKFRGDRAGFTSWLFTIARSKMIDAKRREQRRPADSLDDAAGELLAASDDTETLALQRFDTEAALQLISQLPREQAEIIMLRVVADLDVAEVARIVRKSPGAVRATTHRALAQLRRRCEKEPLGRSGEPAETSSKAVTA